MAAESFQEVGDTILVKVARAGSERAAELRSSSRFPALDVSGLQVVHLDVIVGVQRALEAVGLRGEAGT